MSVAKNPRVVIGATAFAGLAALGGVGAVLGNDAQTGSVGADRINMTQVATTTSAPEPPSLTAGSSTSATPSSSASPTSSGTPTSSAPPSGGSDLNRLMGMLPQGFSSSNCQAVTPTAKDALATVD